MTKLLGALIFKTAKECEPACESKKDQGVNTTQKVVGNDGTYKALSKLLKQEKLFEKQANVVSDFLSNNQNAIGGALGGAGYGLSLGLVGREKSTGKTMLQDSLLGGLAGGGVGALANDPSNNSLFGSVAQSGLNMGMGTSLGSYAGSALGNKDDPNKERKGAMIGMLGSQMLNR